MVAISQSHEDRGWRNYAHLLTRPADGDEWQCSCKSGNRNCWHKREASLAAGYHQSREKFAAMDIDEFAELHATQWPRQARRRQPTTNGWERWEVYYQALADEYAYRSSAARRVERWKGDGGT